MSNPWRDRHHRGLASATGPTQQQSRPRMNRHSPLGAGALSLARASNPPTEEENTRGQVYRTGRACVKLHAGGGRTERETTRLTRGGDERAGSDRGTARDPEEPPHVPGRRDADGLATRGVGASRRGVGRDGGRQESRPEERQAGRIRTGRAAQDRCDQDARVQGTGPVHEVGQSGEGLRLLGGRHRAGEEPAQERAALERRGVRGGTVGVREAREGAVAGQVAGGDHGAGRSTVRGARRAGSSTSEGRKGDAGRGTQAPGVGTC